MAQFPRPVEGSWTEHYPNLGTGVVSYEDCISPEFYAIEREAIFLRAWLNVGRAEDVRRSGSYFTKEIAVAFPKIAEALAYCDRFPLDGMPDEVSHLLQLVDSTIMAAMCIEIWHQPKIIHGADARLERIGEPFP